jgi:hypothetical protein
LARACGSYPQCRWFNSDRRYQYGPMVKWLRHSPFKAVTGVQVPLGSPVETALLAVFLCPQIISPYRMSAIYDILSMARRSSGRKSGGANRFYAISPGSSSNTHGSRFRARVTRMLGLSSRSCRENLMRARGKDTIALNCGFPGIIVILYHVSAE